MSKTRALDTLSWNQRFALIDTYSPTDEQICNTFGVTTNQLSVARDMRTAGTLAPAKDLDVSKYSGLFVTDGSGVSKHSRPETSAKRPVEAKKRGRKGDKIQSTFAAIPASPVNAEQFTKQHNISMAVLRQSKRFDKTGLTGVVRVKKDKASKSLMVWREAN